MNAAEIARGPRASQAVLGKPDGSLRQVSVLAVGTFALGMDAYVTAGLLPAIGHDLSASIFAAGQLATVFTLCYAIGAPVFATILANKSARVLLLSALVMFTAANLLAALAPSLLMLLIARAVAGFGAGLYSPIAAFTAGTLVSVEQRGRALAIVLGGLSAGTVLGVPLGLLIAQRTSWRAAFWMVVALGIIATVSISRLLPTVPISPQSSLRQRLGVLSDRRVSATVVVTLCQTICSLGLYTYLAPVLRASRSASGATVNFWAWGIGGVVGTLSIGVLLDKLGRPALMIAVLLLALAFSVAILPLVAPTPWLGLPVMLIWGWAGWSFVVPQQQVLFAQQGSSASAAIGLNSAATYFGAAVGASIGGAVLSMGLAPTGLPLLAGGVALVAVLIHLLKMLLPPLPAREPVPRTATEAS
jgi:predicted MFS family arabinose efflux permease